MSIKVVRVDENGRPEVTTALLEDLEERYVITGDGWQAFCQTGKGLRFNFVATEIVEYLHGDLTPGEIVGGWAIFTGPDSPFGPPLPVPDFVVKAAVRYMGIRG